MIQIKQTLAAFLAGVFIAGGISAIGGRTKAQGGWKVATVDVGSIQHNFYTADSTTSEAKTIAETNKQTEALTSQGYEPFAASVYNNGIYSNEKVWFFRKHE